MSGPRRGPLWTRGAPRRSRPFWTKQRPWGRGGPWWLRPRREGVPRWLRPNKPGGPGLARTVAPNMAGGSVGAGGASVRTPPGAVIGWITLRAAAVIAAAVVFAAAVGFLLQRADGGPAAAWARTTGHDALWMGHAWVDGRRSPAAMRRLAARIRISGISDVYVLVGRLNRAGRLSPAEYAGAHAFLANFHAALPRVKVSAWLAGATGGGNVNLADRVTRAHVLAVAAATLRAGFGGVHYDFRPLTSGDRGLLRLLAATRALHPNPLSVAAPKLEPVPGLRVPAQLFTGNPVFWTTGYLTEVARRVDQVTVASYDTGLPFRSWYGGYVERETALALQALPRGTDLRMALPAFHTGSLGHHAAAETVAAAVHGIRVGLTSAGRAPASTGTSQARGSGRESTFGVALFADDTATSQDWAAYQQGWVRPGK